MELQPTIRINTDEFIRNLRTYVTLRIKESLDQIINRKMLFVIRRTRALTPKADRSKISAELGATSTQRVSKKSGKLKWRNKYAPTSLAVGLVQWKRHKAGEPPLTQAEAKAKAAKLIGSRLKAVGSLKAGWVKALNMFAKALGSGGDAPDARVRAKGSAMTAKPSWNPTASAEYDLAIVGAGSNQLHIDSRVSAAAAQAFEEETRSMEDYISKKLREAVPQLTK